MQKEEEEVDKQFQNDNEKHIKNQELIPNEITFTIEGQINEDLNMKVQKQKNAIKINNQEIIENEQQLEIIKIIEQEKEEDEEEVEEPDETNFDAQHFSKDSINKRYKDSIPIQSEIDEDKQYENTLQQETSKTGQEMMKSNSQKGIKEITQRHQEDNQNKLEHNYVSNYSSQGRKSIKTDTDFDIASLPPEKNEMERLKDNYDQVKVMYGQLEDKYEILEEANAQLQRENDELKNKLLKAIEDKVKCREELTNQFQEELRNQNGQIDTYSFSRIQLPKRSTDISDIQLLKDHLQRLQEEIEREEEEVRKLKLQISNQINEERQVEEFYTQEMNALSLQLEEKMNYESQLVRDNQTFEKKIEVLEDLIKQQCLYISQYQCQSQMREQINEENSNILILEEEINRLKMYTDTQEKEIDQFKQENQLLREDKESNQKEIVQLIQRLEKLEHPSINNSHQIEENKVDQRESINLEDVQEIVRGRAKSADQQPNNMYLEQFKCLEKQLKEQQNNLNLHEGTIQNKKQEVFKISEALRNMEAKAQQNNIIMELKRDYEENMSELTEQVNNLRISNEEKDKEINQLKNDQFSLNNKQQEQEQQILSQNNELSSLNLIVNELQEINNDNNQKIELFKDTEQQLKEQLLINQECRNQIQELEAIIAKLSKEIEEYNSIIGRKTEEFTQAQTQFKEESAQQKNQFTEQIQHVIRKLNHEKLFGINLLFQKKGENHKEKVRFNPNEEADIVEKVEQITQAVNGISAAFLGSSNIKEVATLLYADPLKREISLPNSHNMIKHYFSELSSISLQKLISFERSTFKDVPISFELNQYTESFNTQIQSKVFCSTSEYDSLYAVLNENISPHTFYYALIRFEVDSTFFRIGLAPKNELDCGNIDFSKQIIANFALSPCSDSQQYQRLITAQNKEDIFCLRSGYVIIKFSLSHSIFQFADLSYQLSEIKNPSFDNTSNYRLFIQMKQTQGNFSVIEFKKLEEHNFSTVVRQYQQQHLEFEEIFPLFQ